MADLGPSRYDKASDLEDPIHGLRLVVLMQAYALDRVETRCRILEEAQETLIAFVEHLMTREAKDGAA